MAEPSQAKTPRLTLDGEDDNIDRLSPLPQCVLLHILSLLDLKEAAATSVLSTNWRDLFLQLPNIELIFSVNGNGSDHARLFRLFTLFANRVLQERSQEAPITNLQLSVRHFTGRFRRDLNSLLVSTAAAVSTYKVKELDINIDTSSIRSESTSIVIPPAMFSSETLTALRLALSVGWDVPESVWLPKLRYTHFIPFRLEDENSIQRLLNGCPTLENFMFVARVSGETPVKTLRMSSSSLKHLMVNWDVIEDGSEMNVIVNSESLQRLTLSLSGGHKVNVDTPNLKYLSIRGEVLEFNLIQSFVSIHEAVIEFEYLLQFADSDDWYSRSQNASTLFNELQNLTLLSLSEDIMKALYVSGMVMPTFKNLYSIRLTPDYCHDIPRSWISQVLFNLFGSCPNLEVLSFHKVFRIYFTEDVQFENVFPLSFIGHLKEVQILSFQGREIEYKLVEFFMNNGQSLETVSLRRETSKRNNLKHNEWKPKQQKRILSFETCSDYCEIIFR